MELSDFLAAAAFSAALSADAFVSAFAYGGNGIKLPFKSAALINFICAAILGVSMAAGEAVKGILPDGGGKVLCFLILAVIGLIKLFDGVTKSIIRRFGEVSGEIKFKIFNFRFITRIYAEPESADADSSKTISPAEAVSLAIALSFDGAAAGFGAAVGEANVLLLITAAFAVNGFALYFGQLSGKKAASSLKFNVSWLGGIVLIILGISKIL